MLVHNGVFRDARVVKEAMSLRAAGYLVEIHGIAERAASASGVLPQTDIEVFLSRPAPQGTSLYLPVLAGLLGLGAVVAIALVDALFAGVGGDGRLAIAGALWLAGAGVLYRYRALPRRLSAWLENKSATAGFRSRAGRPGHRVYAHLAQPLLASVLSRPRPEVIHLHDHVALTLATALKQIWQVPLIWDAHEIYQEMAGANLTRSRLNAEIIATQHRQVEAFITINDSIAAFYRQHYPALPGAAVVMNATVAETLPDYDGRLHRAAGLPAHQKILLFQGGFARHRGIEALVDAARRFPPEWTLVLMGWGNLEPELRAAVAAQPARAAPPAVVFLPGVPHAELPLWSAGASLGAIPYENTSLNHLYCTPNKLWEYPNAGVPVLASDLEEMGRFIREYRFGFLLPREFAASDIERLVRSVTAEQLAEARQGCARFMAANNWSHASQRLLEVYARLAPIQSATDAA